MPRPTNDAMIEREAEDVARAAGAEIRTLQSPPAPPTLFQRLMGKRTLTGGKKRRTRIIKNSKKRKIKAKKTKKAKKAKIRTKKR